MLDIYDILIKGAVVLIMGASAIAVILFAVGETVEHFTR